MATFLITNDDGVRSPGLKATVEAVLPLGDVTVVAPSSQQTSAGRSFGGDINEHLRPIDYTVKGVKIRAYHANCPPARLILHALDVLFRDRKPDLLVSGINYGENLGSNVTLSGTIGAALQAATQGIRGLAMSVQTKIEDHRNHADLDWTTAMHFTRLFARALLTARLPADVDFLNVNVPSAATPDTPWALTRLSRQPYFDNKIAAPKPDSRLKDSQCVYGFDVKTLEPESDIRAFTDGLVTATPMSLDLTSRADTRAIRQALKSLISPPASL